MNEKWNCVQCNNEVIIINDTKMKADEMLWVMNYERRCGGGEMKWGEWMQTCDNKNENMIGICLLWKEID